MDKPLEERVGINENEIKNVKEILLDMRDNHLKSIYERLDRLPVWATIVISLLSAAVVYGIMRKGG